MVAEEEALQGGSMVVDAGNLVRAFWLGTFPSIAGKAFFLDVMVCCRCL